MAYNPKDKNPSGVVLFGNNGSDQVFESVTDFVYDTGNTRLGISTSSPQYTLDVSGTGAFHTIRFADGTEMITSGGGGGGTTYTAGTGLTLIGNEFSTAGTGTFDVIEMTPLANGEQPAYQEGAFFYDDENKTVTLYNDVSDMSVQIGQETHLRVRNNTTGTIFAAEAVRITGAQGSSVLIDKAIADDDITAQSIGLATHDIAPNNFGYITTFGTVNNVDTSLFNDGDEVFLSPVISGGLTGVTPIAPDYRVSVGYVVRSHPSVGSIVVSLQNPRLGGFDIKSLGNIQLSGIPFIDVLADTKAGIIATNTGLSYDSGNQILQVDAGGVRFPDGATQTIAYTGQETNVTGTASGIAFFGDDNNLTESSKLVFTSGGRGELNIDNQTGIINVTEIETTGSAITLDYGTAQLVRFVEGNFSDPVMVSFRNNGFGFRDGNPAIFDGTTAKIVYGGSDWYPHSDGGMDHGRTSHRWKDYYGYRVDLENDTSSSIVLKVQGAASQSANLQEWRNSSDTELASVGPAGRLYYQSSYSPISDEGTASSFTFDLDTSNVFSGTLSAASTLTTSNGDVGQRFLVRLKQGSGGSKTVSSWFGGRVSWPGGSAPTLSSTADHVDLFGFLVTSGTAPTLYYDGFTIATGIQ